MHGDILIHDAKNLCWRQFSQPVALFETRKIAEVRPILQLIEQRVDSEKLTAVGFLSYEAAAAFDPALVTHSAERLPLLWFGLYESNRVINLDEIISQAGYEIGSWQSSVDEDAFAGNIQQIKDHIAAGETYQVNYTFRLNTHFSGDPLGYFLDLQAAQNGLYGAYIDGGEWAICSASPELFFTLDGNRIESRPMKGTTARGLSWQEDVTQIDWLQRSEKNRAENVMIVDMIRNDMGRVAEMGSVHVPSLFDVSRYPTVLQMTSTVRAETTARFTDILAALFPCASITGAPKVRTMEIIHALEQTPRGVYCGAIGFLAPKQQAQFNVAIRTVTVDVAAQRAEYGTGGGIVWDSQADDEYRECRLKAQVLMTRRPPFCLLESMLFDPEKGLWLLDEHLTRLQNSAGYFNYPLDVAGLGNGLHELADTLTAARKIRILLARNGETTIEAAPLIPKPTIARLGLANTPVQSRNPFLYHKTTIREMYTQATTDVPNCDDILLWNERGEVTETTTANVVFLVDGEWVTPPIASGLLAGTYREGLLRQGKLRERVVKLTELDEFEGIGVINSVRGWREAELIESRGA